MTKHRSPDERASQILDAARECFLQKGYFATRMDEIAEASGLSKGGIYFHFDSKKDIFRTLVEQEYEQAMEFIDGVIDSQEGMAMTIANLGKHFTERFATTDAPKFMAIIVEMGIRDDDIRSMLLSLQESYIERLSEMIEEGIENGQLRPVDPDSAALLLKAIIDGIQAGYGIGYDPDNDRLLQTTMQILGKGLMAEQDSD
jgi:AcrR family transcriptional regulator